MLSHADAAECLNSTLEQCTSVINARRALNELFREPQQPKSMNKLLKYLFKRPSDKDNCVIDDGVDSLPGSTESLCSTRRVLVTPLRVWPQLPEMNVSNRILRKFARFNDRFVRVTFVDEDGQSIFQAKSSCIFNDRIRLLLSEDLMIAGYRYVFLAFSSSQLRTQSAWFYDEGPRYPNQQEFVPTADAIRASMGDLSSISVVGKYAARLGQGFSSTTPGASISQAECHTMPDIMRNGYTFSDGIGVVSYDIARQVQKTMRLNHLPSAMQIRIGGSKGVVSLRPAGVSTPVGKQLQLPPSMTKFADNPDLRFYVKQSFVIRLLQAVFPIVEDRFLREWVASERHRVAAKLRANARIYVPKSIVLIGIMDEIHALPWNQVFFQSRDQTRKVPRAGTTLAVGRNPCVHPGDIRLFTMADIKTVPWLCDLYDVLVFSAHGPRPQVNMMSGGDFDGDLYVAIWDPVITKHAQEQPPMKYTAATSSSTVADNPIGSAAVLSPAVANAQAKEFFVDFMQNDNIGQVSNADVALADANRTGVRCSECIRLAELHSIAVDFCKIGVPAELPCELTARSYHGVPRETQLRVPQDTWLNLHHCRR